jgi:HAD superfamily hydrolase (TIGR01509 family)
MSAVDAVMFDLDGVIIDSEGVWNAARHDVVVRHGGRWRPDAQREMMGMSSTEWSAYMHERLEVPLPPEEISAIVVARLAELYSERLPLIPGAREAVIRLAAEWPLGLASSANRPIIELVLDRSGLRNCFVAAVSSEEVPRGKPAPDVYLEAARRVGVRPDRSAAVEDSSNGLRSAAAAGMTVIAIPNREFPPADDALALAADVLQSIEQLTPERVRRAGAGAT